LNDAFNPELSGSKSLYVTIETAKRQLLEVNRPAKFERLGFDV
jgi:hypothetical protein